MMSLSPANGSAMLHGRRILLVISGGIAAYKSLDLIRRLRERGAAVRCILTEAARQFVTPLAVAALSEDKAYSDLWSLTDESEMGHIRLSREADLVVVAPATADLLARMAAGMANDLASTTLLATDKPVLVAPAMNVMMWHHQATQDNLALLQSRGVLSVGPNAGPLADGEAGMGRVAEPLEIVAAIEDFFAGNGVLKGRRALVTSGPTHEPIDPVRYIANRSSGKQGHAIAAALAGLGAETVLVAGPSREPDPPGVRVVHVETARQMLAACEAALPADIAVCAAAVADWRVAEAADQNPDILKILSEPGNRRPALVIGFAAETQDIVRQARAKLARKGCDWILANDVSPASGTFGGDSNTIHLVEAGAVEDWPALSKQEVARRLAERIGTHFAARGGK
jgi:phosphopantothenoylcysteine decarboxylase / phosphopantothenate---cysteine ligase